MEPLLQAPQCLAVASVPNGWRATLRSASAGSWHRFSAPLKERGAWWIATTPINLWGQAELVPVEQIRERILGGGGSAR